MSLPVTANRTGEEAWSFTMSPGGLVSALLGKKIVYNFDNVAMNELNKHNKPIFIYSTLICGDISLKGLKEFETKWIGLPGVDVHDAVGKKALSIALAEKVHVLILNSHIYYCKMEKGKKKIKTLFMSYFVY